MPEIKLSNQEIILLIKILNKEHRALCEYLMENYIVIDGDLCKIIGESLENLLTKLKEASENAG